MPQARTESVTIEPAYVIDLNKGIPEGALSKNGFMNPEQAEIHGVRFTDRYGWATVDGNLVQLSCADAPIADLATVQEIKRQMTDALGYNVDSYAGPLTSPLSEMRVAAKTSPVEAACKVAKGR